MAVVLDVFPDYHRVVAVDPDRGVVMRDGEREDLWVDLILALYSTEELDDAPHRKGYAVSVLPVCDVERRGAAFHLASQEREVHVVRGYEEGWQQWSYSILGPGADTAFPRASLRMGKRLSSEARIDAWEP